MQKFDLKKPPWSCMCGVPAKLLLSLLHAVGAAPASLSLLLTSLVMWNNRQCERVSAGSSDGSRVENSSSRTSHEAAMCQRSSVSVMSPPSPIGQIDRDRMSCDD